MLTEVRHYPYTEPQEISPHRLNLFPNSYFPMLNCVRLWKNYCEAKKTLNNTKNDLESTSQTNSNVKRRNMDPYGEKKAKSKQ
jgi:hypothetical protein